MQPTTKRKQILIVEDEGLIAADIQERLERLGYCAPVVVSTGEEAIRRTRSELFDLVLMDIRLKGEMDGIATAKILKDELQTPVVYLTAHSDLATVDRAKVTEPLGYIVKPVNDGDLRSVVHISLYKHEMERRLRISEAWLSTSLRSVGEGIIATDTTGGIVFMNRVAAAITGWSPEGAFARQLTEVLPVLNENTGEPAPNPIFDLLEGEMRAYRLVAKTGAHKTVEVECFENRSENDVFGSIIVVRDISERRQSEDYLVQSQRIDCAVAMARALAHDFGNHVTVIRGITDELEARLTGEDKERIGEIREAVGKATSLIQELRAMADPALSAEVFNLNDLIREGRAAMEQALAGNQKISTELSSDDAFVSADRNQLTRALTNLTLYARAAMPGGGEVKVETSIHEVKRGSMTAQYTPGRYARLRLSHTGESTGEAATPHLFEPFFKTGLQAYPPGVGLSIVHRIVSQSRGYINVSAEPGHGTSFDILLPLAGALHHVDRSSPPKGATTAMVVEEEDAVREMIGGVLRNSGYQTVEAAAESAEGVAAACQDPIHILITDASLKTTTGADLAGRLRRVYPKLKVLFITGYRHDAPEPVAFNGQAAVLAKPFPTAELLRLAEALVAAGGRRRRSREHAETPG